MAESFPMNGGNGIYSYTQNSQYQRQASDYAKRMITEAIVEKLDAEIHMSVSNTFRIVDFGCSVGPNTFFSMENIIEAVKYKCSSEKAEFQVSFNDHDNNDFNTLFASLPRDRQYHVAGVPGSFYGRLFPRASINLAHSSYALQWLSKLPKRLSDSKSTAWNESKIHYTGSSKEVANAYAHQFEEDMGIFISARAEEIVTGGLMVLIIPAIPVGASHAKHISNVLYDLLGSSLTDLASEGVVDKAKIDSFNLPIYTPTSEEMKKVIEKNGCFSIEKIELVNPMLQVEGAKNIYSLIVSVRAALEGIFSEHFGNAVVDKMFNKTLAKSEEISQLLDQSAAYPNSTQLFVVLKRK